MRNVPDFSPDFSILPLELEIPELGKLLIEFRDWLACRNLAVADPKRKGHLFIADQFIAFRSPGTSHWKKISAPLKQGRNELCDCGSQEKFKHCCGSPLVHHNQNPRTQ